ncbi:N-6 DNA methylase [Roseobacter weihaiensis]|uniref:N-6 DNA methylase n=1 Tax=Roseobacter weihaiensis TaxID=2763262 RepID=UPI001D0A2485|nr:N-6 DNA methylase [Roseobacter sp. H9]
MKEFVGLVNHIDRSKHRGHVFTDFCEMAYCALSKQASPFEDQREKLEAQYEDVERRYESREYVHEHFGKLLALASVGIAQGGSDFLGVVAGELGALDGRLGQFFTPYTVSRLSAEMTFGDVSRQIEEQGFVTVQEPAAGAGGMLMAVADVIEDKGHNLQTSLWIEAVDLSITAYHMCYVQCAARGLAGKVLRANSISLEVFSAAYTPAAPTFVSKHGDPLGSSPAGGGIVS